MTKLEACLEVHHQRLVEHDIQTVLLIQKSILVIKLSSKYLKNTFPKKAYQDYSVIAYSLFYLSRVSEL